MTMQLLDNLAKDEWFNSDVAELEAKAWYEWMLTNSVQADQDYEIVIRRSYMEANELKAFFAAVRKDIDKVCAVASPGSFDLNGKVCGIEACPYNGFCEAAQRVSDSLIDYVCEYCANDIAATEGLFVTRGEFEELKGAVSKLRKDLTALDIRITGRHAKKYR